MKITFVLPGFSLTPIGGFRVVYEYGNRLAYRGHEVSIVHPLYLGSFRPRSALRRLLKRPYCWSLFRAKQIRGALGEGDLWWQPVDKRVRLLRVPQLSRHHIPDGDAVFATAWKTAEHVLRLPSAKGQKFYLVMDFDPWLGPKDRLEATWRWPLKKVTISRWLYDQVSNGVPPSDATNIPIGVDHSRFRLTTDMIGRSKRVAMLYGYADYKAPQDGLAALEIVKARHPDLEVVIFGPFSRPPALPSSFVYVRNIPEAELIEVYNSSRVFVCSSIAEGFALPPAEAMACGCAVAATDCGGIREYAEHEVTALLSPPRDPEALAHNIIRLLEDEELRQKLATAGHRRVQELTWDRSTERLEQFISEWLTGRATSLSDHPLAVGSDSTERRVHREISR